MKRKTHRMRTALSLLLGSALLVGANAVAAVGGSPYDVAIERAKAQHEQSKSQCDKLSGNDRDVCVRRADAEFASVKAQAEADRKGTTGAELTARKERLKQDHRVAREECDSLKGSAKEICVAQANASKERGEAQLKAAEEQLRADYKLAITKCDQLSGNSKSACVAEAKNLHKPE